MSDLPELPATHDPFELLGLDTNVDARTAKRAYVALIKRYRPETHAAEFGRIHAAYQQALVRIEYRQAYDHAAFAERADDDQIEVEPGPEPERDDPGHDQPSFEIDRTADRWIAMLDRGQVGDALVEIDETQDLARAIVASPQLEAAALRVVGAGAWTAPRRCERLFARIGADERDHYAHLCAEMLALQRSFGSACARVGAPPELARFMREGLFVSYDVARQQCLALRAALDRDRAWHIDFLDLMSQQPELHAHLEMCLAHASADGYFELAALEDLDDESAAAVKATLKEAERRIALPWWLYPAAALAAIIAGGTFYLGHRGAGSAVGVGTAVLMLKQYAPDIFDDGDLRRDRYVTRLRPLVLELALHHAVPPSLLRSGAVRHPGLAKRLPRYGDYLDGDLAAHMFALIAAASAPEGGA